MRPFLVLLGLVLGSAGSIAFSLLTVAIVFTLLRPRYPRLDAELEPLLVSLGIFAVLTAAAAVSFYAELKGRAWRHVSALTLGALLLAVGRYYWPE